MTTGQGRVTDRRLDMRLAVNRKRPADASGATQPSHGLGHDPVPSEARPGGRTRTEYNPEHNPSLIGSSETEFDRIQKRLGLALIDNEVLRDLLEHAWGHIAMLSGPQRNHAAEAFRARIWAHLHDEEAACPTCDHYIVNHGAAGPCAVYECDCQGNDDYSRSDVNGTPTPSLRLAR